MYICVFFPKINKNIQSLSFNLLIINSFLFFTYYKLIINVFDLKKAFDELKAHLSDTFSALTNFRKKLSIFERIQFFGVSIWGEWLLDPFTKLMAKLMNTLFYVRIDRVHRVIAALVNQLMNQLEAQFHRYFCKLLVQGKHSG